MAVKFIESYRIRNWYKLYSCLIYIYLRYPKNHPFALLQQDAALSTVEFIKNHMPQAVPYFSPKELLLNALSNASKEGEYVEFGVYRGGSLNLIAQVFKDKTVWGFDSFEGLPNNWLLPKGSFSLNGALPKVRKNVKLVKGWFSDTASQWFNSVEKVSFMHIDCDLFESTNDIFEAFINSRSFKPSIESPGGVIIVFDDYFNQPFWQKNGHKSFMAFLERAKHIRVSYIGYASKEICVRIAV